MQKFVNQLYRKYLKELRVIDRYRSQKFGIGNSEMSLSRSYIQKLFKYIAGHGFKNEEEEIRFFKNLLPPIHAQYIFHLKMVTIEQEFCSTHMVHKRVFLHRMLREIKSKLKRHSAFCKTVDLDHPATNRKLFLRSPGKVTIPEEYELLREFPLCTAASLKLSEVLAYQQLQDYWGDLAPLAKSKKELENEQQEAKIIPITRAKNAKASF
jgi:hypothetical protein